MSISELRKKAMRLPLSPGVYLMKDSRGGVIYVGKAKALKNRVSQYFGSQQNHGEKTRKMVENVSDFDYIITDSEFEALVLECSLIKQHMPKYNILLKDDKGYCFIKVTRDGWPGLSCVYQKSDDGALYIGPYTSTYAVSTSVSDAIKIYRLPRCAKVFPRDIKRDSRPCLNFFIKQCAAPCAGKIGEAEYRESVDEALAYLKGGGAAMLSDLKKRMEEAAEKLEFEKAAKLRDRIRAIEKINQKQKVYSGSVTEQDVFALASENDKACLNILRFTEGRLTESEFFIIDTPEDLRSARHELIRGYYAMRDHVPPKISVDGEVEDEALLCEWLSSLAGRRVTITQPKRGEQLGILELCGKNASERLLQELGKVGKGVAALRELAEALGLKGMPEYIESYDISHTAGADNAAGMVVFKNGAPLKSAYKRFSIKGFTGQDDYASMAEVIRRRFTRYLDEKESGEGFGRLPDLILLDGGIGQVHAVLPVLCELGVDVPVFGMVKDGRHRTRAIASDGGELSLTAARQAFTLVSAIQEEVHRFSVSYHHKKRKKAGLSMTLTEIEGIGEARAKALMKHFKTLAAIKAAGVEELEAVVPKSAADKIYTHFNVN
ncbi:MAG: excinuclease ABC subunit UvrC [Oscillospiraceae bacterium]|nr:excinuclease ABC subunit UvrC [Oscillospiraceae bacterium]